ncbi:MAG: hypothetical protein AB7O96_07720 [Pseudobdellovibrionaceae bacterium]
MKITKKSDIQTVASIRVIKDKKTEHSGAKNGGGHWGPREEAKARSTRARRANSKEIIKNERQDLSKLVGKSPACFNLFEDLADF